MPSSAEIQQALQAMLDPERIEEARRRFQIEGSEIAALDHALQRVVDLSPAMLPNACVQGAVATGSVWEMIVMAWPLLVMVIGGACLGNYLAYRLILRIWFRGQWQPASRIDCQG